MTLAVATRSVSGFGLPESPDSLEVTGDLSDTAVDDEVLVPALRDAIQKALGGTRSPFCVRIEPHGNAEIAVRISGRRASLQLAFERYEAEPGYVAGIVRDAVERFAEEAGRRVQERRDDADAWMRAHRAWRPTHAGGFVARTVITTS